ncbi:MAG: response regulator [Myxococcota bacterium]
MSAIRILLVDDHTIVREGLRALLSGRDDMTVVGEASTGTQAVELATALEPDVVVMDLTLPGISGLDATELIAGRRPETRVLVLSMHDGEEFVRPAIRAGASGYLVKGSGLGDLVAAIRAVAAGQAFFSPAAAKVLLTDAKEKGRSADGGTPGLEVLTAREQQVLKQVALGQTSQDIADDLGISVKTVEGHRANLMAKLGLRDLPALVRLAIRTGLVGLE